MRWALCITEMRVEFGAAVHRVDAAILVFDVALPETFSMV